MQRRRLLTMESTTFRQSFIDTPCQTVKGAWQVRWRLIGWNVWLGAFFRLLTVL